MIATVVCWRRRCVRAMGKTSSGQSVALEWSGCRAATEMQLGPDVFQVDQYRGRHSRSQKKTLDVAASPRALKMAPVV